MRNPLRVTVIRWFFPELGLFETVQQRKTAWKDAVWTLLWCRIMLCVVAIVFIVSIAFLPPLSSTLRPVVSIPSSLDPVFLGLMCFLSGLIAGVGTYWLFRRRIRWSLRESLFSVGVPVCMRCGYCLRGLSELAEPRCPECGEPFDPEKAKRLTLLCGREDGVKHEENNTS